MLASLAACAAPAPSGPPAATSSDPAGAPLIHPGSGQVFPARIGDFRRTEATHFAPDGSDLAVAYDLDLRDGRVSAVIYVHAEPALPTLGEPAGHAEAARDMACSKTTAKRVADITAHYGIGPDSDRAITLRRPDRDRAGRLITFDYATIELEGQHRARRIELALFCRAGDDWTIEFRFAYPLLANPGDAITRFMRSLPWTGRFAARSDGAMQHFTDRT